MKKLFVRLRASQDGSMAGFARTLILAAFVVGALVGALAAAYGGDADEFARLDVPSVGRPTFAEAAVTMFRYPMLAALCGFAVFGVIAEPLVIGVRGVLLAFTFTALGRIYGAAGLVFAAAASAVQILVALPAAMRLASQGFCGSAMLVAALRGRAKASYTSVYLLRMALIFAFLILGTLAEIYITPWLAMLAARLIT